MSSNYDRTLSTTYTAVVLSALFGAFAFIASPLFAGEGTFTGPTWAGNAIDTRGKLDVYGN